MSKVKDGFAKSRHMILDPKKYSEKSSWPDFAATHRLWKVFWKNPMMKFLGTLASTFDGI